MVRWLESKLRIDRHSALRYLPLPALMICVCFAAVARPGGQSLGDCKPDGGEDRHAMQLGVGGQSQADVARKNEGCVSCHTTTDEPTMHPTRTVRLACIDCHGGDSAVVVPSGAAPGSPAYEDAKNRAHPKSDIAEFAGSSANPVRPATKWLRENYDYIRFINPGDLRVAPQTCGQSGCHVAEVRRVQLSMMTHGAMLWGAALYNNGAYPYKNTRFGESYSIDGEPQAIRTIPPPTPEETKTKGVLPELTPLERWEISQPGNVLRVFERGGGAKAEVGNPDREEESGRPDDKLSSRGFGTELRTDPVFLGLQKTRLLDPLLYLPGTNDHPGDYRGSGCTACHVIYANDRSPEHSGPYAQYGNLGETVTSDPTIPKNESGHPIRHTFTRAIPSSQCMVCHVHPGTNMETTYFGYTWWDNEADGEVMYPAKQRYPTEEERYKAAQANPEGAAVRGLWSDPKFLAQVGSADFNKKLKESQFGDFHSHGWVFRAVFKRDRKGNLLDADDRIVSPDDPRKFDKAVHMEDIHLEKGMHCIDCHFEQDNHGDGKLYQEPRAAIELDCIDCHGTIEKHATLVASGFDAPASGMRLDVLRTPWRQRRFEWRDGKLFQRSMVEPNVEWEVVQTLDTITPGAPHFNEKSRWAKTVQIDGKTWGAVPADQSHLAHPNSKMTCYACHTSWTTNCWGCHLAMMANQRRPMLHYEGLTTRNWTTYSFQVLRDDGFMLGIDGTVTGHRVAPARSSCAILVSSQNANREWLYYMQQTVSADGFAGTAFSTFVPHTVRAKETKACDDCHLTARNDNNAWMAQVLLQGTNLVNFMGRYIYVADGKKGFYAVAAAEHDEPPAIYGSYLQKLAYPDDYKKHIARKGRLRQAYHHEGEVLDVALRGEYLYTAEGKSGIRVYDVADVDNKGFSERVFTAPVSPIGQKFYLKTKNAQAIASPSTLALDPARVRQPENEEQPIHPIYAFLYVADSEEGLIVVGDPNLKGKSPGVSTLLDGDPNNNFLKRALAFNPGGTLTGAHRIAIVGTYAYILCNRGLVVVDLDNPLAPKVTAQIGAPELDNPRGIGVQFRYAFVVDRQGLKVLDVTSLASPKLVPAAFLPVEDARNIYVARTYAYISAGRQGIVIADVERPEHPRVDQVFSAEGQLNDVNDVKIGMVDASAFAFVADGRNGMRILQLLSPQDSATSYGFSPRPTPKLIATFRTSAPALAISKGTDRDRAADESGNQLGVFGRRGARPFNHEEAERLYIRDGEVYTVTNDPPPLNSAARQAATQDAIGKPGNPRPAARGKNR
ncbi:MAG TPA: hypothetical protein VMJ93_12300 [Verrucomicrobiae bacterium]|nr:hypothetical protein [Verrucomicrobiae bacterium]